MWKDTEVTRRLRLDVPIVQGPFGGNLSSVELVATVSNVGGLGSFGVHHLTGEQIRDITAQIRAKTSRAFALNLWMPMDDSDDPRITDDEFEQSLGLLKPYFTELGVPLPQRPQRPQRFIPCYEEQIEAVLDVCPPVFSFVFGIPAPEIVVCCKERGIVTLGAATTSDEAVALEQAGIDMVVATGFEAGGHRVSFLRGAEESLTGTLALVPQTVDAVRIPVIAAGGIADGRGIAAALALGAQAVQIGTAFLACRESSAGDLHREMLFSERAKYTDLTRTFSGRLARGMCNRFMQEMRSHQQELAPYPVQNWFTNMLKSAAITQGRPELMSLWCGQAAPLLQYGDAKSLMEALVEQTSVALKRYSA